ncbi:MAG TPA: nucleotidyl transferase AbiEii/AbiGii toxin family protein [Thermoanaerobaculia bacterium]|nr:nucleotidyl transferase AbiEii/AbiGii toxin family protein [Thermoanaerobaculia bacterium]
MNKALYFDVLYPLQDRVLGILRGLETGFYLSGGTAASRGYLHHRFSDDLDLFVNDQKEFGLWADRLIQALEAQGDWKVSMSLREQRFARLSLTEGEAVLKIEMINDVPSHIGALRDDPTLGKIDSPENILANKVTALVDREEPKDLADVWGFCCRLGLPLAPAIEGAGSKAAGIFPADVARRLCVTTQDDWKLVRWIDPPDPERYVAELVELGEKLIL